VKRLLALYDDFLGVLATAAAVAFGAVSFFIAYEVTVRWLGFRPPVWPVAISEFTMLYATVLAAPWVLRQGSHVQVSTLAAILPARTRSVLGRALCFLGMAVCLVVAWYALRVTLTAQGLEIRSFEMPKWLVYAPLPLGFLLLAVEFARHMVAGTLFAGEEIEYFSKRRQA
jgi:TRAP-type C4-dicarboxylate transport system permease small subunit